MNHKRVYGPYRQEAWARTKKKEEARDASARGPHTRAAGAASAGRRSSGYSGVIFKLSK